MHAVRQKDSTRKGLHFQMSPRKDRRSIVKKRVQHLIKRGGSSVELFMRQTRAVVSPRKDCAHTDSSRRVNRLQNSAKVWKVASYNLEIVRTEIICANLTNNNPGGRLVRTQKLNSRASRGTVNPPTPWNNTVAVRIKLKSIGQSEASSQKNHPQ